MEIEKVQLILANVALLFIMHILLTAIHSRKERINKYLIATLQILIVTITSVTMMYFPIEFGEYRFDFRILPLMLLAFILGWRLTIPALIIVALVRLSFGGAGALPGVLYGIVLPTIVAMVFSQGTIAKMKLTRYLTGSASVILMSDLLIIIVVPNGWEVFKEIFPLRFVFYMLSSYFIYLMIIENRKRIELQNKLQFYANHDPLTGLYNNRSFFERIKDSTKMNPGPYYIAMLDIDYFKKINDTYGHVAGDKILATLSEKLLSYTDKHLVVGRYGGEEFIIHLSSYTPVEALNKLEEIRIDLERKIFFTHENEPMNLTVSIGFTNYYNDTENMEATIDMADQELYKAKDNGRNQISTNLLQELKETRS
jgi:diguanylate cyclase